MVFRHKIPFILSVFAGFCLVASAALYFSSQEPLDKNILASLSGETKVESHSATDEGTPDPAILNEDLLIETSSSSDNEIASNSSNPIATNAGTIDLTPSGFNVTANFSASSSATSSSVLSVAIPVASTFSASVSLPPPPTPILLPPVPPPTPVAVTPILASSSAATLSDLFTFYGDFYHLDQQVLRKISLCESGNNPKALNEPYAGLFQFQPTTWIATRNRMGKDPNSDLRFNAEEAIKTAAFKISNDGTSAWYNCSK